MFKGIGRRTENSYRRALQASTGPPGRAGARSAPGAPKGRPSGGVGLLRKGRRLALWLCAFSTLAFGVTTQAANSTSLTPVLSVSGQTVYWKAVGTETSYKIAISNEPRSSTSRATQYLSIPRQAGETQSYTPTLKEGQTVYIGVSADGGLTWSAEEATVTYPVKPLAPVLHVNGQTVEWNAIGSETSYKIAVSNEPRGSLSRTTQYVSIARQSGEKQFYTPTLKEGQTVYIGVSADGGLDWSAEEATVTEPVKPTVPVLSVSGETLNWTAVPGVTEYTLATILNPTTTRETTYTIVTGTSYTPPQVPGQTVAYGMSASVPGASPWAKEVTIAYPPTTPAAIGKIIGTNDGAGWGEIPAATIIGGHITWNRVEIGASWNTIPRSLADGFNVLAIVGNTPNGTPLSQIQPSTWATEVASQIQENPGMQIAEAGNEMYFKGGVANPVRYGRMYMAAINTLKAAGIKMRLLFNMWGDYSSSTGFSSDSSGGGWLREAVKNVAGLGSAILANGLSTHPYGALGENWDDEAGVNAVAAQESVAQAVLGAVPPVYITEFGYDLSKCGAFDGACSQQEQASKMRSAYEVFLADSHVTGIWWYQSHDDSTGQFGFMNNDNTTRPSFNVLSSFAVEQGQ